LGAEQQHPVRISGAFISSLQLAQPGVPAWLSCKGERVVRFMVLMIRDCKDNILSKYNAKKIGQYFGAEMRFSILI
jgi:hypothetical protein